MRPPALFPSRPSFMREHTTVLHLCLASLLILLWRLLAFANAGATLYVDEAQYWLWSQHLDWGYFSKPPGIAALILISTSLFGDAPWAVKLLCMLCYPASAWVARAIAICLYDRTTGNWTFACVLTLPMYAWLGWFASTDAPLILCWSLALLAYLNALSRPAPKRWLLLGLACAAGLLSKYTMLAFLFSMGLYLALRHRSLLRQPGPWLAISVAVLCLLPNLAWNLAHDFPTLRHTAEITLARHGSHPLTDLLTFIAAQWIGLGLLSAILLLHAIRARLAVADPNELLLLCFCLPLWALATLQAIHGGANANWAAPALLPACILLVAHACQQGLQPLLKLSLLLNLIITALAYHAPAALQALPPTYAKLNPLLRATGWDGLASQLRPLLHRYPDAALLADNRTLLAHLGYELRDLKPALAAWQAGSAPADHFQLTYPLARQAASAFLFIGENPPPAALSEQFAAQSKLAELQRPAPGNSPHKLLVYLLHERKTL